MRPSSRVLLNGRLDVTKVQPALDTDEALGQSMVGKLLLSIGCSQMAEMLNDGRLSSYEIRQASLDLAKGTSAISARIARSWLKIRLSGLSTMWVL